MRSRGVEPYGSLCVFDREVEYGNEHGPERLALLYLGADGIATYDALYCQRWSRPPYALLLQDHGFGGNYDRFGRGGLLERIAIRADVFPEWILTDRGEWVGFDQVPDVERSCGGINHNMRELWRGSDARRERFVPG